ncbi:MAG: hypothetical protein QW802_04580 [Candidatus Altiarchaeota archaeon]
MPVVNFQITKIEAIRKNFDGEIKKVDVKSNFTISSIRKGKDERIGDYLDVTFKFDVNYSPDIGNIIVEGVLWYYSKDLKSEILEEKKGRIALRADASSEISNAVLQGSLIEAIILAKKVRLPIPIKLPSVNLKQGKMEFNMAS